jgi:hypothetical protein
MDKLMYKAIISNKISNINAFQYCKKNVMNKEQMAQLKKQFNIIIDKFKKERYDDIELMELFFCCSIFCYHYIIGQYGRSIYNPLFIKYIYTKKKDHKFFRYYIYYRHYIFKYVNITIYSFISNEFTLTGNEFIKLHGIFPVTNKIIRKLLSYNDLSLIEKFTLMRTENFCYYGYLISKKLKRVNTMSYLELYFLLDPNGRNVRKMLRKKFIPNQTCFNNLITNLSYRKDKEIDYEIQMITQYGFDFTQKHFEEVINHNLYLIDPKRYDITITDSIKEFYKRIGIIPNNCDEFTMLDKLEYMFLVESQIKEIKENMKVNRITPNMNCLKNACKINNKKYIEFIINVCHVEPTNECVDLIHKQRRKLIEFIKSKIKT